jgi:hypothetical protein
MDLSLPAFLTVFKSDLERLARCLARVNDPSFLLPSTNIHHLIDLIKLVIKQNPSTGVLIKAFSSTMHDQMISIGLGLSSTHTTVSPYWHAVRVDMAWLACVSGDGHKAMEWADWSAKDCDGDSLLEVESMFVRAVALRGAGDMCQAVLRKYDEHVRATGRQRDQLEAALLFISAEYLVEKKEQAQAKATILNLVGKPYACKLPKELVRRVQALGALLATQFEEQAKQLNSAAGELRAKVQTVGSKAKSRPPAVRKSRKPAASKSK